MPPRMASRKRATLLGESLDGLQKTEQIQRLFLPQGVIVVSGHAPTERAELAVKKEGAPGWAILTAWTRSPRRCRGS